MKLVTSLVIIIAIQVNADYEHLMVPRNFQNQNGAMFSTENSVYLPPESHTPVPYFSIKDFNNLPFPYLPPNNKGHNMFPTPFPFMISTSLVSSDDNDENNDRIIRRDGNKSTAKPPQFVRNINRTETTSAVPNIKREMRPIPNNFKFSQQIDRNDLKPFPFAANNLPNTMKNTVTQAASPRSLIISPDNNKVDQIKSGSFLAPQYLTSPGLFVSSTVEPAIPILRLSNEMDLDGSFSYEALGADQTHYVQHSRMENFGSDKQEQVVEGSYSYVGDDGQTYTVHYIADSNGFRATGDHLPVAPPIPEIIQRSIQYNLAEEARNPSPYKQSWEYGNSENDVSENEKIYRFAFSPPQNLFTGKTPESFSHAFSQASNKHSNLITAASSNNIKTVDFTPDQMKPKKNTETISPQITFVASQGAHSPLNKAQQQTQQQAQQQAQQVISRMFTTDKPTMPQLMNYEAAFKDAEQENNKALWRWQYGLNADNNKNSNKNTISRSSSDDVIINFNDMTPDQYSQMIKTDMQHDEQQDQTNSGDFTNEKENTKFTQLLTSTTTPSTQDENRNKYSSNFNYKQSTDTLYNNRKLNNQQVRSEARAKLITLSEFLPPSQTVTQSYDYLDSLTARKIKSVEEDNNNLNVIPLSKPNKSYDDSYDSKLSSNLYPSNINQELNKVSTASNFKFTDFIIKEEDKQSFKPMISTTTEEYQEPTTEAKLEDSLKENIFLKSIFNRNSKKQSDQHTNDEYKEYNLQPKNNAEPKSVKSIKHFAVDAKPFEEPKGLMKKPVDMADILRFMSSKTNFESNKIKPKTKADYSDGRKSDERFISEFNQEDRAQKTDQNYDDWNHHQQEELKGLIKNYKVLQRNNNGYRIEERTDHLRRITPTVPGSIQSSKLPPLGRAGPSIKSYLPPIYV